MLSFLNIASGSKGNATVIYSDKTTILLDAGISKKRIVLEMESIGKTIQDLQGILITHEHSDHICGLSSIRKGCPVYASEGTVDFDVEVIPGVLFTIGDISVFPFSTSHDANNPVGYIFKSCETTLCYITDTGFIPEENLPLLKNATYYIMESNHDLRMLLKSNRPQILKDRIRGDEGHLSNADCAYYLSRLVGDKTKGIYLAHLSEECNTPEKAIRKNKRLLEDADVSIIALKQHESTRGGDDL